MKYRCDICGSTSHPTEEHMNQIEGEIETKEKAPLSNSLNIIQSLDTNPSSPETVDFVSQPVEEWLKSSKDKWLKEAISTETERHRSKGLDGLYSETILKSMFGRLNDDESKFKTKPQGKTGPEYLTDLMREASEQELFRGYHRIWAKNLSRSEVEGIYFNAVKDSKALLVKLENSLRIISDQLAEGKNPQELMDKNLIELLHWRDNLFGAESILLDWGQINDTNLNESRRDDTSLKAVITKIDEIGDRLISQFPSSPKYLYDERLNRIAMKDAWHSVHNDWWVRPANWRIEADIEFHKDEIEQIINPTDKKPNSTKGKK